MAVTKIHPIKSTLKKALDYIENPAKTDEKMLVSSFACSYETADIEFELLLSQAMQKGNNLAHHLIQSFAPGETTPEQAHEIGRQLADIFTKGKYCIFSKGRKDIFGVGNFFINLTDKQENVLMPLVMLDSNMYGDGWFFSGFDCIHEDQTEWCMNRLSKLKKINPDIKAMAFFHMPVREFKEAYEKMKLGDKRVVYEHGSIAEKDEYFGISYKKGDFFKKAVENGIIKWMFCGHDHLNTLSLTYKGIRLTYGMSIDCLGYNGISKSYIQRGGTLITRKIDGRVDIKMIPLTRTVSTRVRGESKNQQY